MDNINGIVELDLSNNKNISNKYIINNDSKLYIKDISTNELDREYEFILNDNAYLEINKFYNINTTNEKINIYLNGINSSVNYNFSTLINNTQTYNINIFHNNKNTKSNIINRGVVKNDSILTFEVNATVKKGSTDSALNQDNKIITYKPNKSIIKPNLFIDEYLVEARHGASIGFFNKDQLFYLKSRGINEEDCYKLLTKGFLLKHLNIENKQEIL